VLPHRLTFEGEPVAVVDQPIEDRICDGRILVREGYTFQTALGLWMGMNHMNGRVQDAVTGRFLSADPNIPDPTLTQSYDRFSYVNNNPLSLVDPSGFASPGCPQDCPKPINDAPFGDTPPLRIRHPRIASFTLSVQIISPRE